SKRVRQLVGEARLDLACDLGERRLVGDRQIGEHLAVDVDVRPLEPGHEHAVGHSELAYRRVDPRDPQGAEHALFLPAVAVGVLPRLHLRLLEDLLVARSRDYPTLDSRHGALLRTSRAAWNGSPPCWCGRPRSGAASGVCAWWSSW